MAKPKIELMRHDYSLVVKMAAAGCTEATIAKALYMAPRTLRDVKKRDPKLLEAIEIGRAVEHDHLVGQLRKAADDGNIVACMFLLKSRHGYNDRGGDAAAMQAVQVNISLPEAMTREDALAVSLLA